MCSHPSSTFLSARGSVAVMSYFHKVASEPTGELNLASTAKRKFKVKSQCWQNFIVTFHEQVMVDNELYIGWSDVSRYKLFTDS